MGLGLFHLCLASYFCRCMWWASFKSGLHVDTRQNETHQNDILYNDIRNNNKNATLSMPTLSTTNHNSVVMLSMAFCTVTLSKMTLEQCGILCNDSAKCHTQHNDHHATLGIQCCYAKCGILHCYTQ